MTAESSDRQAGDNGSLGERTLTCRVHGKYQASGVVVRVGGRDVREIWSPCPDCSEAILVAERQAAAEKASRAEQARIEAMLSTSAIPRRFVGRTLGNYRVETDAQRNALRAATDFARDFDARRRRGDALVLLGPPGTGKSHLAAGIMQAIMPRHCGLYTTASGIVRAVRDTWQRGSQHTERQVYEMFCRVPLLVIDEVGVQSGTDNEQHIMFEILDRRYRDMEPVVLLSNLQLRQAKPADPPGLREMIGERSFDRLVEVATVVLIQGESFRARARDLGAG